MAAPAILKIDIIADATKAAAALNKTGDAAQKTGGKFSAVGKAVAGGLAVGSVIAFGKASFAAAEESAQATARLDQVFKSMGDTTGNAAKEAENYASALSKKTAIDDEAIMAAQAQLATFGAVSDETARAAGIFDRATAAAADLAAAGFGSLDGNAVQLGKALQDPIKGLAALGKSGVTFTKAQKDQIAAMVKAGDTLGAQKIVLGAVEGQVKGTAEATATGSAKMSLAFGEVQEAVGAGLIPVFEALSPIIEGLTGFIADNAKWLGPMAAAIGVVVAAQWAWNAAMAASPLTLIVLGIAAVIAGIILLVKNWDKVKAAFMWVFEWVKKNWPLLLAILTGPIGIAVLMIVKHFDAIKGAVMGVFDWIKGHWPLLLAIITGPIGLAVLAIVKNFDTIKEAVTGAAEFITRPFREAFDAIARLWNDTVGSLKFEIPSWVPGVGGKGFDVPDIPTLMYGGSVSRTGLAVVHAGERFSGVSGRSTFGGGGSVVNIHIHTDGLGASSPQIQRAVANALRGYTKRNGPLDIAVKGTR
jgi:hypothetical protein